MLKTIDLCDAQRHPLGTLVSVLHEDHTLDTEAVCSMKVTRWILEQCAVRRSHFECWVSVLHEGHTLDTGAVCCMKVTLWIIVLYEGLTFG